MSLLAVKGVFLFSFGTFCCFRHENSLRSEHLKAGVPPGSTCAPLWEPAFSFKRIVDVTNSKLQKLLLRLRAWAADHWLPEACGCLAQHTRQGAARCCVNARCHRLCEVTHRSTCGHTRLCYQCSPERAARLLPTLFHGNFSSHSIRS